MVNCDACEDFSGDFRNVHLIRSADGCSEDDKSLFYVIAGISMSRESMVFV